MKTIEKQDIELSKEMTEQLTRIRRHIHQYPELSFQEYATCEYIISCLQEWKIPYEKVGDTGIVVDIIGEMGEGLHIGVRADIDALPIEEKTGLSFSSQNHGVMHACGHDGHTAILLGTVYQLFQFKHRFSGRVRCIFQPGEEADGAAEEMIQKGVLESPLIDEMIALHLWPHLPFGTVGIKYGAITASCDNFMIEIVGKGGHSARPHQGIDAIAISANVLQALSLLVTKSHNPIEPVVVHVGKIQGGTASNVVADQVVLEGTTRTITMETRQKIKSQIIQLVEGIVNSYGAKANVTYTYSHPPVINDEALTHSIEEGIKELLGANAVYVLKDPSMGADDFGAFAVKVPSTYFRLGIRQTNQPCYDLHHPEFQFDDQIIAVGVKVFTYSVLRRLLKGGQSTC